MPAAHAWIFQATPTTLDLPAELRSGEVLAWSVARYGREVRPGDRVYYWLAGRDAGIYGVGRVREVSARDTQGRYTVQTSHERALFAPITRAELRADPALRGLAVLRQPRGTVFPLTSPEAVALARRTGESVLSLAVAASRAARGKVSLSDELDGELPAQVEARRAQGDEVVILLVADDGTVESRQATATRRRRNGDLEVRLAPAASLSLSDVPPHVMETVAAGRAVALPDVPPPSFADAEPATGVARAAEQRATYGGPARFAPDPDEVRGDLALPDALVAQVVAAVNAGQHIVLMGLPGTGKTSLALNLARAAARSGLCSGHLLATGTADWTTFDTIGGLVPTADGTLRFAEGVVLRALREDRWLVLDELNRADIDKAFGPLLTVLAGAPVELPTVTVADRPIRIEPRAQSSGRDADGATYRVGPHWRIVGTMNTLDRAALFSISLAFARRFAFILVPPPDAEELLALVQRRVTLDARGLALLQALARAAPRPLGPAVVLDAARYLASRAGAAPLDAGLVEAVGAFVLPQLEGVDGVALRAFVHELAPLLGSDGEAQLLAYVDALYGAD